MLKLDKIDIEMYKENIEIWCAKIANLAYVLENVPITRELTTSIIKEQYQLQMQINLNQIELNNQYVINLVEENIELDKDNETNLKHIKDIENGVYVINGE